MGFTVVIAAFGIALAWFRLRAKLGWQDALMRATIWALLAIVVYFVATVVAHRLA